MRRRVGLALALFLTLCAHGVRAECEGRDQLAAMRSTAPAEVAKLETSATRAPFAEGRFFAATRDGKTSWLFGTFHDAHERIAKIPAPLQSRLRNARLLLVEISESETRAMSDGIAANPDRIFDFDGPLITEQLSPALVASLKRVLPRYGMSLEEAERMRPWFLVMLLSHPPCALNLVNQGKQVLDARIMSQAKARGIPVKGLETASEVFKVLDPDEPGAALNMLRITIATAEDGEDLHETVSRLYLDGQIQMIWQYSLFLASEYLGPDRAESMFQTFEEYLLRKRNLNWMPTILEALSRGDTMVAVGALHLPGEFGLLNLLEKEGYTITRIPVPLNH